MGNEYCIGLDLDTLCALFSAYLNQAKHENRTLFQHIQFEQINYPKIMAVLEFVFHQLRGPAPICSVPKDPPCIVEVLKTIAIVELAHIDELCKNNAGLTMDSVYFRCGHSLADHYVCLVNFIERR